MAKGGGPKGQKKGGGVAKLSAYVMGLSALLGGSTARQYKSCIFGARGSRPKPGHVARCNRLFFGSPMTGGGGGGKRGGPGRSGGAHSGAGGGSAKIAGAGPGQASKRGEAGAGPGKRRAREGR